VPSPWSIFAAASAAVTTTRAARIINNFNMNLMTQVFANISASKETHPTHMVRRDIACRLQRASTGATLAKTHQSTSFNRVYFRHPHLITVKLKLLYSVG
jgi:hypothetical protein